MQLEAMAAQHEGFARNLDDCPVVQLGLSETGGVFLADWEPLIPMLMDETIPLTARAAGFHFAMADSLLQQAIRLRENTGVNHVGLAGGVFQNRVLTERCITLLNRDGFEVTLPRMVPVNDAGISFGQIVDHAYRSR